MQVVEFIEFDCSFCGDTSIFKHFLIRIELLTVLLVERCNVYICWRRLDHVVRCGERKKSMSRFKCLEINYWQHSHRVVDSERWSVTDRREIKVFIDTKHEIFPYSAHFFIIIDSNLIKFSIFFPSIHSKLIRIVYEQSENGKWCFLSRTKISGFTFLDENPACRILLYSTSGQMHFKYSTIKCLAYIWKLLLQTKCVE